MPQKTSGDLLTLDFVNGGRPYVKVSSKDVSSEDVVINGLPANFQKFGTAGGPPGSIDQNSYTTSYVKVSSTWKEIDKFHGNIAINQSGTWRYGDTLGIRVGNFWRTNDHGTAVPTELVDSPSYSAGSSNNSYSHGSASNYWVWNNRKGLLLTGTDIKSYSGSGASKSYDNNYNEYAQDTFTIPSDLKWVYALLIGGGAGGNGVGAGDGGGGGGFAFAKLDLRNYSGQSLLAYSGKGGNQYTSGTDSYLTINGTEVMRATGGTEISSPNYTTSNACFGGYGIIDESHGSYIYGARERGGYGTSSIDGTAGATGGGGGHPYEGGDSLRPWCGAGSGSDGGSGKVGGDANHNYTSSDMKDNQRGIHPVDASLEYSAISSIPFFGDSTSSNAFDGKDGRSTTGSTNSAAGFFGSGGGGSGSGSGFEGGPGAVILWWS